MAKNSNIIQNDFYCTSCGKKGIPISRKSSRGREAGHLKKLFCLNCNKEVNHVECIEFSHYSKIDFDFEFNNNNFDENGNRILDYGQFRAIMHDKGIELP